MLRGGAIVPHAPLVALKGDPACIAIAAATRAAWMDVAALDRPVVVLSPHGDHTGVSTSGEGNLDAFGPLGISVSAAVDGDLAQRIAEGWRRPLVDGRLDHGATGALAHAPGFFVRAPEAAASYGHAPASGARSVVTCTFAETTGPEPAGKPATVRDAATALADLLFRLGNDTDFAVVASVHGAASVTPRAPLTELPEGRAFDDALLDALATDNAAIADIPEDLFRAGGTCSTGPLHVWARLFGGRSSDVHAYDAPAGVGYLVATCL